MLSRWKLTDNLLRSLAPAGLFFLLFSGWAMLPLSAFWTWGIVGIVLLPGIMVTTLNLFQKSNEVTWKQHLDTVFEAVLRRFFLGAFNFACLPYEVLYTADRLCARSGDSRFRITNFWNGGHPIVPFLGRAGPGIPRFG